MQHEGRKTLSRLRLDNARTLLITAERLVEIDDYKSAANRAYYAVFSAMRAELAILGIDYKKHSGVISAFRLNFIKSGILDIGLSNIITDIFSVRTEVDYNDFYVISKSEVENQIENAKIFVSAVESHLNTILGGE